MGRVSVQPRQDNPIGFPEPTILSLHMQLSIVMILCAQTASTGMEGSKTRMSCSHESQVECAVHRS